MPRTAKILIFDVKHTQWTVLEMCTFTILSATPAQFLWSLKAHPHGDRARKLLHSLYTITGGSMFKDQLKYLWNPSLEMRITWDVPSTTNCWASTVIYWNRSFWKIAGWSRYLTNAPGETYNQDSQSWGGLKNAHAQVWCSKGPAGQVMRAGAQKVVFSLREC